MRIGLIADTHGLLRPEALAFLAGCDHILHAGDIGPPVVLEALAALAPVSAVRGNNDRDAWARALPETAFLRFEGLGLCLHHDRQGLPPLPPGVRIVVTGHSHRSLLREEEGVIFLNPGSAGPRRFRLPVTLGELWLQPSHVEVRIRDLLADAASAAVEERRFPRQA